MSRYAISDIHGCSTTFRYLVEEELRLQPTDSLYLLGDYIDRGPNSKGVLDYIMELQERGHQVKALLGNHEDMMLQARQEPEALGGWLMNGGKTTLSSFGTSAIQEIPEKYWQFLRQLDFYAELEDYYLVHAGFDFSAPDPFSETDAMLWARHFKADPRVLGTRKIVHGHTPISIAEINHNLVDPLQLSYNIDGGCVFTNPYGFLVALNLESLQLHKVKNRE